MNELGLSTESLDEMVSSALSQCVDTIKKNSKRAGQVATGKTLRSLEHRMRKEGYDLIGQILGRPYFGSLETGRGPYNGGKGNPSGFNKNLIEWMKARNFQCKDEDEYLRMANYLRWRINKFGTALYRKGGRKDIFTPAVDDLTDLIEKELIGFFNAQIEDKFTRGFQGFGKVL